MATTLYRVDPVRCHFSYGDWGYFSETVDREPEYQTITSVHGNFSFVPQTIMVRSGYRHVRHFAVDLRAYCVAPWSGMLDITSLFTDAIRRLYVQVFEDRLQLIERRLTEEEFRMLVFLDFPDVNWLELEHFLHTADYHDIELVPEKRNLLMMTARLSQP